MTKTVSASTTAAPTATTSAAAAPTTAGADLPSLIPTPANSQRTDGPEAIQEGCVHKHFLVSGSPTDAMDGYKTALEGSCTWPSSLNTNCGSDN